MTLVKKVKKRAPLPKPYVNDFKAYIQRDAQMTDDFKAFTNKNFDPEMIKTNI
jgi:hypothetical protein